jgi:maleate isomerase
MDHEHNGREHVPMENYIGHRAKIGVIIPSTNTAVEYDLQRLVAAGLRGVTWHPARFFVEHTDLSSDDNFIHFLELIRQTIPNSVRDVLTCNPTHIMMGMSAETFWGGIGGNAEFIERIQDQIGDMGLTTGANAVIEALERLGDVRKISVLTPYQPIGDENVVKFFSESGYDIGEVHGLRCENTTDAIAGTPFSDVFEAVQKIDREDVDAIVQVGTNLSTSDVFPTIEKMLGKPVLPINIATAWHALRACGVDDRFDGLGRLFEEF